MSEHDERGCEIITIPRDEILKQMKIQEELENKKKKLKLLDEIRNTEIDFAAKSVLLMKQTVKNINEVNSFIKTKKLEILDNNESDFTINQLHEKLLLFYSNFQLMNFHEPSMDLSKDFPKLKLVLPILLEEEVRENLSSSASELSKLVIKLLDIDLNDFFRSIRSNILKSESSYSLIFKDSIKTGEFPIRIQKFNDEHKSNDPLEEEEVEFKFNQKLESLTNEGLKAWEDVNNLFLSEGKLFKFSQLFNIIGFPFKRLEDLGLVEPEQKLSFLLKIFTKKKDLIKENLFITSYSLSDSISFIRKAAEISVNQKLLNYRLKIISEMCLSEDNKKALIFQMTEDLEQAAGCLFGTKQGQKIFNLFCQSLINPNVPEIIEKMIMLTSGYYLGVKLFFDDFEKGNYTTLWKPNQKTIYRIWKLYNHKIPKELWQAVFPHKFDYIDRMYLRAEGKFVPFSKPRVNLRDPRHWQGRINTALYRSVERSRMKIQAEEQSFEAGRRPRRFRRPRGRSQAEEQSFEARRRPRRFWRPRGRFQAEEQSASPDRFQTVGGCETGAQTLRISRSTRGRMRRAVTGRIQGEI